MREPDGFRDFVADESPRPLRAARLLTHDWHAAEDLVQNALVRALPRWAGIEHPGAWVRRTMLREYLAGRERRWTGEVPTGSLPERGSPDSDADVRLVLLRALAQLPRQQRAVVVLRYFDDQTEAATATLLGCSVGTVKTHASRALAALQAQPALASLHALEGLS